MAKGLMAATGVPGLSIWRGIVSEEYLNELKSISQRARIFKQMLDDPVIGTLMDALWMPLLGAEFSTVPGGEEDIDQQAADFLFEVMNDMNQYSWRDHVQDMLSVTAWGWAISEMVFKKRQGPAANPPSKYDDGRIGLKILDPRGQETLYEWKFDPETYDITGLVQQEPIAGTLLEMEAWKLIHATFRSRKRNPEGYAPLRSLYKAWYTRKSLEMIEAIGSERDLAGLPVIHLPFGAGTTEKEAAELIVRKIRLDEESGIVLPAPPTPEDKGGWKLELLSSGGSKQYNVREVIRDLNKIILMRFFAQFLSLGMERVGTQALVEGSQDFFSLALKSIQQCLIEAWNDRFVPLLFNLNAGSFPGLTGLPQIEWSGAGSKDVKNLTDVSATMVNAGLLSPDEKLEDFLRAAAGLPEKPEAMPDEMPSEEPINLIPPEGQELLQYEHLRLPDGSWLIRRKRPVIKISSQPDVGDVHIPGALGKRKKKRPFVNSRTEFAQVVGTTGRRARGNIEKATNEYQGKLVEAYDAWAKQVTTDLLKTDKTGDDLAPVVDAWIGDLAMRLKDVGRKGIMDATMMGMKGMPPDAEALRTIAEQIALNDKYVDESVVAAVKEKLLAHVQDSQKTYQLEQVSLLGLLQSLKSKPAGLSGMFWNGIFIGAGILRKQDDKELEAQGQKPRPVRWVLDPDAEHCQPASGFYGCEELAREYESWDDMPTVPAGHVTCRGNSVLSGNGIDVNNVEAAYRASYSGPAIKFLTESGVEFAVTFNHPVLTPEGWLPAKLLHKGDYVINSSFGKSLVFPIDENHQDIPAFIEKIWDSLSMKPKINASPFFPSMPDDFHGDARFMDGDVDIILPYRQLGRDVQYAPISHAADYNPFHRALLTQTRLPADSTLVQVSESSFAAPNGLMAGGDLVVSLPERHTAPFKLLGFTLSSEMHSLSFESMGNGTSAYTQIIRQLEQAFSRLVTLDKIVDVCKFYYSGHVYDLQTDTGYYLLNSNISQRQGIVNSNCRCNIEVKGDNGQWERVT